MTSRNILIIVMIILVAVILTGLYFLFFGGRMTPATTQPIQTGTLPSAGSQGGSQTGSTAGGSALAASVTSVSSQPVLDYAVASSGVITAIQPSGQIIQVSNGQMTTLSTLLIQNVITASFSYDGTKVLVNFGDPSNPQTSVFDVASQAWSPMSAGWRSPVWSPSDYRIAYATQSTNGMEAFATFDASRPKSASVSLATFHAQDLSIAWLNKNQLVLSSKPSAFAVGSSLLFNLQKKTLTPITLETAGLETIWSGTSLGTSTPLGLQFSAGQAGYGGGLQLVNTSGATVQQIKFITLPSKCVFADGASSTPYLYCGVPVDQSDLAYNHLPDDYNQMALFTSDNIYRINLSTGALDTILTNSSSSNFDVSDLKETTNALFFLNRYNQELYTAPLTSN